jgi:hypothetical protein
LDVVKHHHERLNGQGYPYGLDANKIGPFTKIVSIVDVYDAITSKRVYHDEITPYMALNSLYKKKGIEFDPQLIERFIKCLGVYPIGSVVELNTGQVGMVSYFSEKHHLSPTILLILDENKHPYESQRYINLSSEIWRRDKNRPEIKRIVSSNEFSIDIPQIVQTQSLQLINHQ